MTSSHPTKDPFTSLSSAHLGQARMSRPREWVAVDNYGQPVATIWTPYLSRPDTFRCDPLPNACYLDSVEADDFSIVLDYALKNFTRAY